MDKPRGLMNLAREVMAGGAERNARRLLRAAIKGYDVSQRRYGVDGHGASARRAQLLAQTDTGVLCGVRSGDHE